MSFVRNSQTVYIARSGDLHKIGYSSNAERRVADMQIGSANQIELVTTYQGGWRLERALHDFCVSKRVHGEWFKLDQQDINDIARFVADYKSGKPLPPTIKPKEGIKARGRPPPDRGIELCPGCARKSRYRDGKRVECECRAKPRISYESVCAKD